MRPDLEELSRALERGQPISDGERRLVVAIYASLAEGRPVAIEDLSRRMSSDTDAIRRTLAGWRNVFRDEQGRIIAFGGLALSETAHRFELDGRSLFTWCAFDPLFIAPLLGARARVASRCPVTGRAITLTVGPDGIHAVEPPEAVLSFLEPSDVSSDDVIERFCHYVLLFASDEAAGSWTTEHPGTFVLELDDAFELGRLAFGTLAEAELRP